MKPLFSARVRVPATTANLGPGFDAIGLSLAGLYNETELKIVSAGRGKGKWISQAISIVGEGASDLPRDEGNLVFSSAERVLRKSGFHGSVALSCRNRIPLNRGLGSSSAAIISGLAAANVFNKKVGRGLSRDALLGLAAEIEGHPDNVAPALLGGLTVSVVAEGKVFSIVWKDRKVFEGLKFVAAVPEFQLPTKKARAVLPARVSRADAVFNVGRAALLLAALKERRRDLLSTALEDRLHQPYRKRLIPGFEAVLAGAKSSGAFGACLSGAGPSILAVSPVGKASAVGRAMQGAFSRKRVPSRVLVLDADFQGARVI